MTLRFDTSSLAGATGWWAVLDQSPLVLRLLITASAAALVFAGPSLGGALRDVSGRLPRDRHSWPWLLGHVVAMTAYYRLTLAVLEAGTLPAHAAAWVLAWLVLGGLAAATLALAAMPADLWVRLLGRVWPALVVGTAVGAFAWGSGLFTGRLWEPLGHATLWTVRGALSLGGQDVVCDPLNFVVGTRAFAVAIAPSCSGYEGIGMMVAFVGGYLTLFRRSLRFPHALLLLPLGAALIWLANAARVTALILIGSRWSREVALGGFHSQAGWLAFNAIAVTLVALAHRARCFGAGPETKVPLASSAAGDAGAAYLVPLLTLVAVSMATAAASDGFDWLYPARTVAVAAALWYYRRGIPRLRWSWAAAGVGVAVFALWLALVPAAADDGPPPELAAWPGGVAVAWVLFRVVGSSVTVPWAEELAFRGYLTRRLIAPRFDSVPQGQFTWPSFLGSSVLFGAMHGSSWLAGTLAGFAYALALYRRRELSDAVLAHATTNALLAAYVLTTGRWSFWS